MIELFRSSSVMRKCTERAKVNQNRANEGIGEFWKATELKSFREAWKTSLGGVPALVFPHNCYIFWTVMAQ